MRSALNRYAEHNNAGPRQSPISEWESDLATAAPTAWTTLSPASVQSESGTKLQINSDDSIHGI